VPVAESRIVAKRGEIAACAWRPADGARRLMNYPEMNELVEAAQAYLAHAAPAL
jgi:hypothetical protein